MHLLPFLYIMLLHLYVIKKCQGMDIDPLHVEDISNETVYNLLKSIIVSPKAENQSCSAEEERKMLSLGQDLVYAVSNGRVITPKHIGVGMTVKHKTNSIVHAKPA